MDGVRPAEVGPAVTSGTRHADAKSPASQRLVRDSLHSSAIERNEVTASVLPGRSIKQVADSSQIAFAFLSDIADCDHWPAESQFNLARGTQDPEQRHDAGAVIGYSGQEDHSSATSHFQGR